MPLPVKFYFFTILFKDITMSLVPVYPSGTGLKIILADMNHLFNKTLITIAIFMLAGCGFEEKNSSEISKQEMVGIVQKYDNQFSIGVQKKDSALLADIYSDSAQYIQPKKAILKGNHEIGKEWADFIRLKEKPVDLILNITDVRGSREIIYETGQGYTLLADSTKWTFNYVNVWRLQKDGSYKLEIDTYN